MVMRNFSVKSKSNNFSQFRRIAANWNHWKAWMVMPT